MAKFTSETVISMFETGNFPEDMDNGSESEDEVLDLSDPDAGIPDSDSEGQQSDLSSSSDMNVDPPGYAVKCRWS